MSSSLPELSVSEFMAVINQTLELAYSGIVIYGELANLRIVRNKWVYFDLKDEAAKVEFFGSVFALPGPLEEGLLVKVQGLPRLHPQYGFSVVFSSISAFGTGSIKRMQSLLQAKLEQEGLFALERKRALPYPPRRIGLITSYKSAAYSDFMKIIANRWAGLEVDCLDVKVQGDQAPGEIVRAIEYFSAQPLTPDALVIIRGGGSPEDLAAFNQETVTRAVAASRVPTLVAIGHERDVCLAELAADRRAATPSHAAELLVPDKRLVLDYLSQMPKQLQALTQAKLIPVEEYLAQVKETLTTTIKELFEQETTRLHSSKQLLELLSPKNVLKRGYALVYEGGRISDGSTVKAGSLLTIEMIKKSFEAKVVRLN